MKKFVMLIVSSIIIISILFLTGCTQRQKQYIKYDDFITSFNNSLSQIEECFEITRLNDVKLDDGGMCYVYHFKNILSFKDLYRLSIYANEKSDITSIILSTDRKTNDVEFALLSLYTYNAMEFSKTDYDSFCDKFDLLSEEKIFETGKYGDYYVTCMTIDTTNEITFLISVIEGE